MDGIEDEAGVAKRYGEWRVVVMLMKRLPRRLSGEGLNSRCNSESLQRMLFFGELLRYQAKSCVQHPRATQDNHFERTDHSKKATLHKIPLVRAP